MPCIFYGQKLINVWEKLAETFWGKVLSEGIYNADKLFGRRTHVYFNEAICGTMNSANNVYTLMYWKSRAGRKSPQWNSWQP